MQNGVL